MSLSKLHAQARFDETQFRGNVGRALVRVTELLDVARGQVLSITYEDKFAVAEYLGRSSVEALLRTLKTLGLKEEHCAGVINNGAPNKRVRLVLRILSNREALGSRTREVTSPEEVIVQETTGTRGGSSRTTSKRSVVQKVTEFPWKLTSRSEVLTEVVDDVAPSSTKKRPLQSLQEMAAKKYKGVDGTAAPLAEADAVSENTHPVHSCTETKEVTVTSAQAEPSYLRQPERFDVDITALLRLVASFDACKASFHIDRAAKSCRTPRRNVEVNALVRQLHDLATWASRAATRFSEPRATPGFQGLGFGASGSSGSSSSNVETNLFHPCIPMLVADAPTSDAGAATVDAGAEEVKESLSVTAVLTEEHLRVLQQAVASAPTPMKAAQVLCHHTHDVCGAFIKGVDAIEARLRVQLLAAVSHELSPADFRRFMRHRFRRMFRKEFRPKLCSFDVRRGDQAPEGSLSLLQRASDSIDTTQRSCRSGKLYCGGQYTMSGNCKCGRCDGVCGPQGGCQCPACETAEATGSDQRWEEIQTFQRRIENPAPMQFAIGASTNITFKGERTVHSWMNSQFADSAAAANELMLQVNARQFSCFLLLLGNVTSPSVFEPKHAFLVRNKDEFRVPLVLHPRASAGEFQDHLRGLSPEQRELAQLMRDIQLSSLLGICLLQVKPQLETALNLPANALTKETELTQALLELFVKHQIPADRLRVPACPSPTEPIEQVRKDVQDVEAMIRGQGDKTITKKEQARRARDADSDDGDDDDGAEDDEECCEESSNSFGVVDGCSRGGGRKSAVRKSASRGIAPLAAAAVARISSCFFGGAVPGSAAMPMTTGGFGFGCGAATGGSSTLGAVAVPAGVEEGKQHPDATEASAAEDEDYEMTEASETLPASTSGASSAAPAAVVAKPFPFLKFPKELEKATMALGEDAASLRPTRAEAGKSWTLTHADSLLVAATKRTLGIEEQRVQKRQAFDLIDALTRTGVLAWDQAHLHIVMAVTQNFASTLIDTCVVENTNPITQVESAMTLLAQNLFERPASALHAPTATTVVAASV
jgi:hypothetical protein